MILIDTHVFLWALNGAYDLGTGQRELLDRSAGRTFVSFASIWEIEIKKSLGKLTAPDDLVEGAALFGWTLLPISISHIKATGTLPRHHGDPFDRMLVAQAMVEGMALVTKDRHLSAYGIPVLW